MTRSWYSSSPSSAYMDSQMGLRLGSMESLQSRCPCSSCCRRWPVDGSVAVSRASRDQETIPSSLASSPIAAISADSAMSRQLGGTGRMLLSEVEVDGCREVASAAVLLFPGRCSMLKYHGRVRSLRRNSRELVISSKVRSPKIFKRGLWSVITTRVSQP